MLSTLRRSSPALRILSSLSPLSGPATSRSIVSLSYRSSSSLLSQSNKAFASRISKNSSSRWFTSEATASSATADIDSALLHSDESQSASISSTSHVSIPETEASEIAAIETEADELKRFQQLADLELVNARVIKTITDEMGYESMTEVQALTIRDTLAGEDV
jgi:hypothetical protein